MSSISRRNLLILGATGVSSGIAGCTSSTTSVDRVSGTIANRSGSALTVAVEMIRPDTVVDFGREYDLRQDDTIGFSLTDPVREYTLRTAIRSGGDSKTDTWRTSDCQTASITLGRNAIDYEFGDC